MVWSVYDRESLQAYRSQSPEDHKPLMKRGEVELDLRAPQGLPDGTYTVQHRRRSRQAGAAVENGMFLPRNISEVCLKAVCA